MRCRFVAEDHKALLVGLASRQRQGRGKIALLWTSKHTGYENDCMIHSVDNPEIIMTYRMILYKSKVMQVLTVLEYLI